MAEYIEREAVLEDIQAAVENEGMGGMVAGALKRYVKRVTAADVAPVRHGRWIDAYPDIEPNPMFMYGICSECGFEQGISKYLNYCPNCGAQMHEDDLCSYGERKEDKSE